MEETKNINYICKNCGYKEEKHFPKSTVIQPILKCPECNKVLLEMQNKSYLERMKDGN